jgi:hypothetical protein
MGDDTIEETTPPTLPCDNLTCNTMHNFDNQESANDGTGIAWALAALAILAQMLTNRRYGYFRKRALLPWRLVTIWPLATSILLF